MNLEFNNIERQYLHNLNTLQLAVVYDNLELVKQLGNTNPELGRFIDRSWWTSLHLVFI